MKYFLQGLQKITTAILVSAAVAGHALAYESHKLKRCIFRQCVQVYYMCDNDVDPNCKPRLARSQKSVLEAYHLCQDVGQKACQHESISDAVMAKLAHVQKLFYACKIACYKSDAPELYAKVFKGE